MKALIFAAGLGTRLAPLTNDRPKALVTLKGKPLLWHVVDKLVGEGFLDITINVHHFAQLIKDYISSPVFDAYAKKHNLHISISDETYLLLDTGGGLRKAAEILFKDDDKPVLIHNVDIMSNAHLKELYSNIDDADAALLVSHRQTSRYLLFDKNLNLVGWQNVSTGEVRSPYGDLNPDSCQRLAFSGIHVVNKNLTDSMKDWPQKFGITDFYIRSCNHLRIKGIIQPDLQLTDIGKIDVLHSLEQK